MTGFARIEKCQTKAVAESRRDTLIALGFQVVITQDQAFHVTSDITVDAAGNPQPADQRVAVEAPWLVIAVRGH